jgi:hypothetical protein
MELFLISFVIIGLALLGMGIGVLFGRGSLKGSCGGLNTIRGLDTECPVCSGNCEKDDRAFSNQRSAVSIGLQKDLDS